jgi:outer membrane receptor protein involved in Fe transport
MSEDAQSNPRRRYIADAKSHDHSASWPTKPGWLHGAIFALSLTSLVPGVAIAQTETAQATPAPATHSGPDADNKREEIVVEGVPPAENIMPTARPTQSVYGLDLGVMETPRNTTILSKEQLQAVNIQDPRSFSYLTSSSFTDSAFGGPNVPRIRGQYADVFYNGMRSSFTSTGYGAPLSFNSIETINITKGPASVIAGPGPGVGGSADFITKRPEMSQFTGEGEFTFDSLGSRRWTFDVGGPIIDGDLGYRISYAGEDSDSYFTTHFKNQQSLYAAASWLPNDDYSLDFNTEAVYSNYEENVGVNRVNQALINNGTYLTGAPIQGSQLKGPFGGLGASQFLFDFTPPYNVGSKGNPFSPVFGILTMYRLGNPVQLDDKITIDETPDTTAHSFVYNAQAIQKYRFSDDLTLENNTFFDYENRDNQAQYYYADSSRNSFSIESKTQLDAKFDLPISNDFTLNNDTVVGGTIRFAHINYIGNFNNEPVGVYDLSKNPKDWVFAPSAQIFGNAFPYSSADQRIQYGVPGRDSTDAGNTAVSDLIDLGFFIENKTQITDQLSLVFGGRGDLVQNNAHDPLGGPVFNGLLQNHSTAWYGLGNANFSPVYQFAPWGSFYLTYDYAQNVSGAGGDGTVGTFGQVPDKTLLQQTSRLYEAGLKFNLLNNSLFISTAAFSQQRLVPSGQGNASNTLARLTGFEAEANYQPERHFFATASYSYLRTRLASAVGFYNYPAHPGLNVDGAGVFAVWQPGQSFNDPGIPQHVFNFLGNYRFDSGLGLRLGVQVTGPFDVSQSGYINVAESAFVPRSVVKANGYFQAPRIPWQYTINASVYYDTGPYEFKLAIYNLTDQENLEGSSPFYGNDFIVHSDPIDAEFTVKATF